MQYLFSNAALSVLERFVRPKALVALDYDGTLAPIVPDQDEIDELLRSLIRMAIDREQTSP